MITGFLHSNEVSLITCFITLKERHNRVCDMDPTNVRPTAASLFFFFCEIIYYNVEG